MTFFQYKVIGEDGNQQLGTVEADAIEDAAIILRERGLFVVEINETTTDARKVDTQRRRLVHRFASVLPIMARDRAMLFRQLSMMLQTGLTLLQSLEVCQKETSKWAFSRIIGRVIKDVEAGSNLSDAFANHPKQFNTSTIQMIKSAEASGELDTIMRRLSLDIERRSEQMVKMFSALFYPVFVFMVATGVSLFLVYGVIPKFATFIELKGGTLPASTQFLMDFSKAAIKWLPWILIVGGISILTLFFAYRSEKGRLHIDRFLLGLPIVGGILTFSGMTRLGFTLSILLQSGLPLIESLRITASSLGNRALRTKLEESRKQIMEGGNLSVSLNDIIIPPTVPQIIAVGEETGNLGEVLDELGHYYDDRLQRRISWLSSITEPALIIIVGSIVGFVYFSFFMAALSMTTS